MCISRRTMHWPICESQYNGAQVFYAKTEGSEELAKKLQSELVTRLNAGSRRQAKESSGIYLMEHIQRPGILVECGFLSNSEECALLSSAEYQKKLSYVLSEAIYEYITDLPISEEQSESNSD